MIAVDTVLQGLTKFDERMTFFSLIVWKPMGFAMIWRSISPLNMVNEDSDQTAFSLASTEDLPLQLFSQSVMEGTLPISFPSTLVKVCWSASWE